MGRFAATITVPTAAYQKYYQLDFICKERSKLTLHALYNSFLSSSPIASCKLYFPLGAGIFSELVAGLADSVFLYLLIVAVEYFKIGNGTLAFALSKFGLESSNLIEGFLGNSIASLICRSMGNGGSG